MDNENKFWLGIWSIAGMVVISVVLSTNNYYTKKNMAVVEMMNKGASLIEISCAVDNEHGTNPTCLVLAAKQNLMMENKL